DDGRNALPGGQPEDVPAGFLRRVGEKNAAPRLLHPLGEPVQGHVQIFHGVAADRLPAGPQCFPVPPILRRPKPSFSQPVLGLPDGTPQEVILQSLSDPLVKRRFAPHLSSTPDPEPGPRGEPAPASPGGSTFRPDASGTPCPNPRENRPRWTGCDPPFRRPWPWKFPPS